MSEWLGRLGCWLRLHRDIPSYTYCNHPTAHDKEGIVTLVFQPMLDSLHCDRQSQDDVTFALASYFFSKILFKKEQNKVSEMGKIGTWNMRSCK